MKIALSRPSNGLEEALELFKAARNSGFTGVQIKPQQYNLANDNPEKFKELFTEYNDMACGGLIVYPGVSINTWTEKLEKIITFASGIGAYEICICSAIKRDDSENANYKNVADIANNIGLKANQKGLNVSLHNHAGSIFENSDDLDRLTEFLDPALCGLTFDTAHAEKCGIKDMGSNIKRFAKYIKNIHLKDYKDDFCPLGCGNVNLINALNAIREIGYDRWLVVDEETAGISAFEACEISMKFLKENGVVF